jgi:hypothetical protein
MQLSKFYEVEMVCSENYLGACFTLHNMSQLKRDKGARRICCEF